MAFTSTGNKYYESFKIAESNGVSYEELYASATNAIYAGEFDIKDTSQLSEYAEYLESLLVFNAMRNAGYEIEIKKGKPQYIKELVHA